MKLLKVLALVAMFTVAGCAHTLMRGSVAMKISNEEAHVCMGHNEVQAGDKVVLFKNVCAAPQSVGKSDGGSFSGCQKIKLGGGTVERTLNEHYSVVKVDPGVKFSEGAVVEKQ